ncbi:DUF1513 domain-containing protein [Celeribacter sp.]|uniref:DUF1513 domain-containing protein n=1 Tax=Celeribacter sp. TaxID=1890673 RepID=UPI003A950189
MTSRRRFLAGITAATLMPRVTWADAGSPAFLGAAKDSQGAYGLYGLDENAQIIFRVPLPARGHAAAAHPTVPEAVGFARRPGTFAVVVNCVDGTVMHRLDAPQGRHFMGHGVFVNGGDLLVTPENNYAKRKGVLGLWDRRRGYARVGEVATGGIGPHDIKRLADGALVVANGGIFTHPDHGAGRDKLNIDTMQPSLTYMSRDFEITEQVTLDAALHHSSIRHLSIGADGQVAFAMQWEGDADETVPLLGLHRRGEAPLLASAPDMDQARMKNYAGSVAFSGDGREVAITSPKGGLMQRYAPDGQYLGAVTRMDICGLAPRGAGWLGSDGLGGLMEIGQGLRPLMVAEGLMWDNHLVSLAALV